MRKLQAILAVSALACAPAALAQETIIIVDLSGISADLATALEIDVEEVPTTVDLSPSVAAVVCDVDESSLIDSCTAVISNDDLIALLQDDGEDGEGNNSAAEFAPGHQEGLARDFAPGQQEGPATDFAPGLVKQDGGDEDVGDDLEEADDAGASLGNSASAPGLMRQDDGSDSDSDEGESEDSGSPSDDAPGRNK